jgi:hypothetical protein
VDTIQPCDHVMHVYESETVLLDSLEGFVTGGLRRGEIVIVIATESHLFSLQYRLTAAGHDIQALRSAGNYVALDASTALSRFMVAGVPDDALFADEIASVIDNAHADGRKVRAFGEMVELLWSRGERDATVRLERLWNTLCLEKGLSLLCAYKNPVASRNEALDSLAEVRSMHSHVILPVESEVA